MPNQFMSLSKTHSSFPSGNTKSQVFRRHGSPQFSGRRNTDLDHPTTLSGTIPRSVEPATFSAKNGYKHTNGDKRGTLTSADLNALALSFGQALTERPYGPKHTLHRHVSLDSQTGRYGTSVADCQDWPLRPILVAEKRVSLVANHSHSRPSPEADSLSAAGVP